MTINLPVKSQGYFASLLFVRYHKNYLFVQCQKTKLFVIFSLPSVTAVIVAVAPEDCPTMVSDVVKLFVLVRIYSIGLDMSIILPLLYLRNRLSFHL